MYIYIYVHIYIYIQNLYHLHTLLPVYVQTSEAFGQGKRLPCRGGNGSALLRIEGAGEGGGGSGL